MCSEGRINNKQKHILKIINCLTMNWKLKQLNRKDLQETKELLINIKVEYEEVVSAYQIIIRDTFKSIPYFVISKTNQKKRTNSFHNTIIK